MNTLFASLE